MSLSQQDREYIELTAEMAAQKTVSASIGRIRSVAVEEVQKHQLLCPGATTLTVWKTLAVIGALLVGVSGIAGTVWAIAK